MSAGTVSSALLSELLELAAQTSAAAAEMIRERRTGEVTVADTKSTPTDVVTEVDRACELLIRERIRQARPGDGMLGEEGTDEAGTTGVVWVADPIDGTVNYLYGLEEYAVSLAAQLNGQTVVGVVANAAQGALYTAVRGQGAYRDGQPLSVRAPVELGQRLIATGFGYDAAVREVQIRAVANLLPKIRDIRRMGSAALDLCRLAEGRLDGYVEEGVHLWDYAAGALIAEEAGAQVETTSGALGATLLIAGPRGGFDALRVAVEEAGFMG